MLLRPCGRLSATPGEQPREWAANRACGAAHTRSCDPWRPPRGRVADATRRGRVRADHRGSANVLVAGAVSRQLCGHGRCDLLRMQPAPQAAGIGTPTQDAPYRRRPGAPYRRSSTSSKQSSCICAQSTWSTSSRTSGAPSATPHAAVAIGCRNTSSCGTARSESRPFVGPLSLCVGENTAATRLSLAAARAPASAADAGGGSPRRRSLAGGTATAWKLRGVLGPVAAATRRCVGGCSVPLSMNCVLHSIGVM